MKRTSKYQLTYFEEGDLTIPTVETQRWQTVDAQLYGLFSVLGNGILTGWELTETPDPCLGVIIAAGSGHVNYVAVSSPLDTTLLSLTAGTRNYIYAAIQFDSFWRQTVNFVALVSEDTTGKLVYLGYVDTDVNSVTNINMDGRNEIGYLESIRELIAVHQHLGGDENPSKINLATDVQGELNPNNLADLDASKVTTGVFDGDRIPNLDHITKLINNGILTHAQLDAFVDSLSTANASLMGDISTTNMLKMTIALKRNHSDIDEDFLNEVTLIPGISPNSYIDTTNSTASWDTITGEIYASPSGTSLRFFTKAFNVGYALKSFLITYEGEIQIGTGSSESSASETSSSLESESSAAANVRFAVSAKDSVNVSDYEYVDPHKVEDISSLVSDGSIKVMIEFNGEHGDLITMGAFAFMFSSTGNPSIIS